MEGINTPIIKAIRSFNLSIDAITKLNQQAVNSGVNRSAYIERLIVQDHHRSKVHEDIEAGIQTTLIETPTPKKPVLSTMCGVCMTDNNTNGHLQFVKGRWTLLCPNGGV